MADIKEMLNAAQHEAATMVDGPLLVIAGAGSGKTRVIEYRVLHLVQSGARPESILLLTFTRRSAREMLSRAERHDQRCKRVEGGTFHSFAFKTLRRYAKAIGFSDSFSILDEQDAAEVVQRCAAALGLFKGEKRFPRKDTLKSVISVAVNKGLSIERVLEKEYPHFIDYCSDIENLREEYARYKLKKDYLDYDDLLVYLRVLLRNEAARAAVAGKYRYIMVDEYQDTNRLQADIAYLLAKDHSNIMAVGDDAQSIYGFRGASHENIMEFPKAFPACRIIKLEENYRSTQAILDVANTILDNMNDKYSKCLVSVREETGSRPRILFFKDAYEEAEWIAGTIKKFVDDGGSLHKNAVLFRSAYVSIPLQAELSRRSIPYQVVGGLKFYETAHVKDVLAYLRVAMNPKDELAWNRVLLLIDGIGHKTADYITGQIAASSSIAEAAGRMAKRYKAGHVFSRDLIALASILKSLGAKTFDVHQKYGIALDHYSPFFKAKFDDWHVRINDLETLRRITERYDTLDDFLSDFAIEGPERGVWRVEGAHADDERPLTLSTIHSAKGLEWEDVFLIGLADGILPISFSLGSDEDIEEESRLFYVAVTRAKSKLFLSLHHEGSRGGITQFNKMSRFLDNPEVLSRLQDQSSSGLEWPDTGLSPAVERPGLIYEKDSLLEDIIDLFE